MRVHLFSVVQSLKLLLHRYSVSPCVITWYLKQCVSTGRTLLDAKEQFLFQARATVYVKEMERAMHTAINHLPLGMRLNR